LCNICGKGFDRNRRWCLDQHYLSHLSSKGRFLNLSEKKTKWESGKLTYPSFKLFMFSLMFDSWIFLSEVHLWYLLWFVSKWIITPDPQKN
jgi:hypothetical protein